MRIARQLRVVIASCRDGSSFDASIIVRSPPPEAGRKTVSRDSGMDARIRVIILILVPEHAAV